jgi:rare lipoprotein A
MTLRRLASLVLLLLAACGQLPQKPATPPAPATVAPPLAPAKPIGQIGLVSFYAASFAGKRTASGAIFDPDEMTMAHRSLPFGTKVRVTSLHNQRSVEVVVNDRGPAVAGRIADLSPAAARAIGLTDGVAKVRLEVLPRPN